jgi:hypothetical protein
LIAMLSSGNALKVVSRPTITGGHDKGVGRHVGQVKAKFGHDTEHPSVMPLAGGG